MSSPSLKLRTHPLADPKAQIELLTSLNLGNLPADLAKTLASDLTPAPLEILQINVGKLCNMTCRHCHVDAAPDRREVMDLATINACLAALDQTTAHTVDITGGAPELNPHFRYLVEQCVLRGKHVINRCNLTVLLLPTMADLPQWFADRHVEVVCSLPHYEAIKTDAQRGNGTFEQSITALRRLNAVGYGKGNPDRQLTLVSNPPEAQLSCTQLTVLEQMWQQGLWQNHGITFDRLITLNNMPIARHLEWLVESGNLQEYMELLVNSFNPATISGLMCRHTLSVSWDGKLFDCDFNQMLDLEIAGVDIWNFEPQVLANRQIQTGRHCFGCTAGKGSSCGGAIATDQEG